MELDKHIPQAFDLLASAGIANYNEMTTITTKRDYNLSQRIKTET